MCVEKKGNYGAQTDVFISDNNGNLKICSSPRGREAITLCGYL
jgi:hypothetical protein